VAAGLSPRSTGRKDGAICIILAAGFSSLESELEQAAAKHANSGLGSLPKALLPVAGRPMLDHWWEYVGQHRSISEVFIVSNALKYKHFERWATAKGMPLTRVINSGATDAAHSRGVLYDVEFALQRAKRTLGRIDGRDVIVFAGDTLFFKDFDLDRILDFRASKKGSLLLYYGRRDDDNPSARGMCEVDSRTSQVLSFVEKPAPGQHGSGFPFVSPLFTILEPDAWKQIAPFNAMQQKKLDSEEARASLFSFGRFVEHAIQKESLPFWGMRMPGAFYLIGSAAGFEDYKQLNSVFAKRTGDADGGHVCTRTYARVGIMGNPSDGFHGKTIAVTIRNFWASVELWESEQLTLLPHPLYDPSSFSGLSDLHFIGRREGYYGGTRLLMATCKRFQELCTSSGIALPRKNFTAKYDTNIPRQVGLAGSSAIVSALFRALMRFYDLTSEHIQLELQPSFVLSVEQELGIQAGLQDRVVQIYMGLVYMDFSEDHMRQHGHGRYERMSKDVFSWVSSLPFFLAYEADPSDSGKIHSNVRARWDQRDPEVVSTMQKFADLTLQAREAMENRDHAKLADLMDQNFATRRGLYGDGPLGQKNLEMVEICKRCGAAAKFPGSGGAVLGLCRPSEDGSDPLFVGALERVRLALEAENYVFCKLDPVMPADSDLVE